MKNKLLCLLLINLSSWYCFGSSPLRVTQVDSTPAGCTGDFPGELTVTIAGGTPPYAYDVGGDLNIPIDDSQFIFEGAPGEYTFRIFDQSNPQQFTNVTASISPAPPLSITAIAVQNNACSGDANGVITVTTQGGIQPLAFFANGIQSQSNTFRDLQSGTYQITVVQGGGCPGAIGAVAILPLPIRFTTDFTESTCNGGNDATLTIAVVQGPGEGGNPPFTFSINGGLTFVPGDTPISKQFTGLTAGTYNPVVQDTNGCRYSLIPIVIPQPTLFAITLTVSGTTITVVPNVQDPAITYSLDGGTPQSSPVFTGVGPGPHSVKAVLDDDTCAVARVVISPLDFTTTTLSQPSCRSGDLGSFRVNATGGVPPYMYSNDGGKTFQASPIFTGLIAGIYRVVVRDSAGTMVGHDVTVGTVISPTDSPIRNFIIGKYCKRCVAFTS